MTKYGPLTSTLTVLCLASLTLTACSTKNSQENQIQASPSSSPAAITEASTLSPRLAITYEGGLMVIDGRSMEVLSTFDKEGFLRLNPAGDNRHMIVADGSSYSVLDLGSWEQAHGDHSHIYSSTPSLSQLHFAADHTGHVISNLGKTALFSDGTASFETYRVADLTGADQRTASSIETQKISLPQAHHGFAIPLANNRYLVSVGDQEKRSGAAVIDDQAKIITENKDCPGIHGEAKAAHQVYTLGCEDGALIYRAGQFTKVTTSKDSYSRLGNQAGSEKSAIVLTDYKTDPNASLERPEQFALINTTTPSISTVALPQGVSYTFRSLARGPAGEALVLTTDGKLRYYDEQTGKELGSLTLMDPWQESETWQDPRPAIWVNENTAYVSDPSSKKLLAVSLKDLKAGKAEIFAQLDLPHTPNEINGVSGKTS